MLNHYRISHYSHFFISSKKEYLAYNSRSNTFIKLDKGLYEFYVDKKLNNISINEVNDSAFNILVKYKFVVKKEEDEDFLLERQFFEDRITYANNALSLVIAPTLDCNFDCQYCFEKGKEKGYMDKKTINQLISFIKIHKNIECLNITWYGGEPLLYTNIIRNILELIHRDFPEIPIRTHSIITNGYYFTKKAIELFKEYPLDSIQITLDGRKERHDSIRKMKISGKGSFDQIISNIDNIVKELPSTKVRIRVNIEKKNISDFILLKETYSKRWNGCKVIFYPGILRIDNKIGNAFSCEAIDRLEANRLFFDLSTQNKIEIPIYPKLVKFSGCGASMINFYVIGPKGEIYKCWNDVSDNSKVIGQLGESKLTNTSLYYRYIVGSKWYHNKECIKCFFLPICTGSCAFYRLKNKYSGGKYELCQCLQYGSDMLNQCLEYWYDNQYKKNLL